MAPMGHSFQLPQCSDCIAQVAEGAVSTNYVQGSVGNTKALQGAEVMADRLVSLPRSQTACAVAWSCRSKSSILRLSKLVRRLCIPPA
jgi:hypothetical protein